MNLLGDMRRAAVEGLLRCCWSLLGRVHVENDAVAADEEASIAGGKRFANALAVHNALLVSIADVYESRVEISRVSGRCLAIANFSCRFQ
jgi:hypothetical protein